MTNNVDWATIAAAASAIAAVIAIVAALYIHYDSARHTKPFEKPILAVYEVTVSSKLQSDNSAKLSLMLLIKNYGKSIATNVKINIYSALLHTPEDLKMITNKTLANEIYPEVIFNRQIDFTIPSANVNLTSNTIDVDEEKGRWGFIVELLYKDKITGRKESAVWWLGYQIGKAGVFHLTLEEKDLLEQEYNKIK